MEEKQLKLSDKLRLDIIKYCYGITLKGIAYNGEYNYRQALLRHAIKYERAAIISNSIDSVFIDEVVYDTEINRYVLNRFIKYREEINSNDIEYIIDTLKSYNVQIDDSVELEYSTEYLSEFQIEVIKTLVALDKDSQFRKIRSNYDFVSKEYTSDAILWQALVISTFDNILGKHKSVISGRFGIRQALIADGLYTRGNKFIIVDAKFYREITTIKDDTMIYKHQNNVNQINNYVMTYGISTNTIGVGCIVHASIKDTDLGKLNGSEIGNSIYKSYVYAVSIEDNFESIQSKIVQIVRDMIDYIDYK